MVKSSSITIPYFFLHSFVPRFWLIRQVCSSNPEFSEMLTHVSTVYVTLSLYL